MRVAVYLGLLLLFSLSVIPSTAHQTNATISSGLNYIAQGTEYTEHDEIIIQNNQDFVSQGWMGSGTSEDPYLISGLEFFTDSTAIEIFNTTAHFIITDCIFSSSIPSEGMGIKLRELQNGLIDNCVFNSINSGIATEFVSRCIIAECLMELTNIPLTLYESDNCTILRNNIDGPVMVYKSDFCRIIGNEQFEYGLSEDSVGFEVSWSDRCIISNNTFSSNDYGLWIDCCLDTTLENNSFVNNGLLLRGQESSNYDIEENRNTINGNPLGYFNGESDRTIDASEFGQVIITSCQNVVVQNGQFENATTGVQVAYSDGCSVIDITTKGNVYGVSFEHALRCELNTSSILDNYIGVMLTELSVKIGLYNNTITQNTQGIGFDSAEKCEVVGNLITENNHLGLGVSGSGSWICYNTFGRNGMNAADGGIGNLWDNDIDCGNWWDDMAPGAVYVIPGDARSVDRFPNGTVGTYTPTSITANEWIGNGSLPFTSPEVLVTLAISVGTVILVGVIVYTKRTRAL